MKYYHGVVLKESLNDTTVLSDVEVVEIFQKEETAPTSEQPSTWTWYRIKVSEEKLATIKERLSQSLKSRAWYTNLWTEGDYLLIFPGKVFRGASINASVWDSAIEYGLSLGIPLEQLIPLDNVLRTE